MRILVATDGSHPADLAVEVAAALPIPAGSVIRAITVVDAQPLLDPFGSVAVGSVGLLDERVAEGARAELSALEPRLRRPDVTVESTVLVGRAAWELAEAARTWSADLLIVGSRGRGPILSMLLGSVSAELVRDAPCPVLVARRNRAERVLLATDGSESARAAEMTLAWPIFDGCSVEVVAVGTAVYHPSASGDVDRETEYATAVADAASASRAVTTAAAGRLHAAGRSVTTWSTVGDPAGVIIDRASVTGADVVVMGTRGLSGVDGLLLGSVARNVLTHARCSVLVVPAG